MRPGIAVILGILFTVIPLSTQAATTPPPSCTITITPASTYVGSPVLIKWTSSNASSGSITPTVGSVGPSGSKNVFPPTAAYTTYRATFSGPGGTATCQAGVSVSPEPESYTGGSGSSGGSGGGTGGTYRGDSTQTDPGYIPGQDRGLPNLNPTPTQTGGSYPSPTPARTGSTYRGDSTQTDPGYISGQGGFGWIVPCGNPGQEACQACHLVKLAENVVNFFVYFSIAIATLMFAWAGILYVSSATNPKNIETAHGIFWSVFVGLIIVLSAWLVVDTIMKTFVKESSFGPWNKIQCVPQPTPSNVYRDRNQTDPGYIAPPKRDPGQTDPGPATVRDSSQTDPGPAPVLPAPPDTF